MSKAILLVNLGSPDSPSVPDVRRYLNEFLMDGRVIDTPWLLRRLVVGLILVNRPKASGHAYEQIWTKDGSPLVVTSKHVRTALQKRVSVPVELAMRYQNPSIESAVKSLAAKGATDVLQIPLFPHYAMSSYETAVVRVQEVAAQLAPGMKVTVQPPYFDHPDYIAALVASAADFFKQDYDHLLFSYHGIPERHLRKSDPTGPRAVLSRTMLRDHAGLRKTRRRAGLQIFGVIPITPWQRSVAQTLHGLRTAPARAGRQEEDAGDLSGIRFGLP
jgi:ferrochelatase